MSLELDLNFTAADLRNAIKEDEPHADYKKIKQFILDYIKTRSNSNANTVKYYKELHNDAIRRLISEGFKVDSWRDKDGLLLTISW